MVSPPGDAGSVSGAKSCASGDTIHYSFDPASRMAKRGSLGAGEANEEGKRRLSKHLSRLTPALRQELKHALRDASDWHPRLSEEVAKLADINHEGTVRSRIYVTSASTMHSLFNVLRHGQCASGEDCIVSNKLGKVTDLNYLTHLVFRCYERIGDQVPDTNVEKDYATTVSE